MNWVHIYKIYFISINVLLIMFTQVYAVHRDTNGCGSDPYSNYVPDKIMADFTNACNNHDLCYGRLGQDKETCDNNFHNEMKAKCRDVYQSLEEAATRELCYLTADGYYEAVKRLGGDAYRESQAHALQEASIEELIGLANPNETIRIPAGEYYERITITKPIRLESQGGIVRIGVQ